jgi:hypothetical protein
MDTNTPILPLSPELVTGKAHETHNDSTHLIGSWKPESTKAHQHTRNSKRALIQKRL